MNRSSRRFRSDNVLQQPAAKRHIVTVGREPAKSQPDALARDSAGNQASNSRSRSTPFVPQGRATPRMKHSQQRPRSLATQSLANASGCDGGTLRVLPLSTDASGHPLPLSPKRGDGSGSSTTLTMLFLALALLLTSFLSPPLFGEETEEVPDSATVQSWIDLLDHENYAKREWATERLARHPDPAFPAILNSFESSEGERRTRLLKLLLNYIDTPNSPNYGEATQVLRRAAMLPAVGKSLHIAKIQEQLRLDLAWKTWEHIDRLCPTKRREFTLGSQSLHVESPLYIAPDFEGTAADLKNLDLIDWTTFARLEGERIDRDILAEVLKLPRLQHLQISNAKLTVKDLELIQEGPNLTTLELMYLPIGDELIELLPNLPVTSSLWIYGTQMTLPGAERATKSMTDIEIFVSRGAFLGLMCQNNSLLIESVLPDSAAEKAGLRYRDRVTKVNDTELKDFHALLRALSLFAPGEKATIEFVREVPTETGDTLPPLEDGLPGMRRTKSTTLTTEVKFGRRAE